MTSQRSGIWFRKGLRGAVRAFVKGLLAILPLGAAIFVFSYLASTFEGLFAPIIKAAMHLVRLNPDQLYIYGMGIVFGLVVITLLGLLLNALIFRQLLEASEAYFEKLPLARTVIHGVRDLMGFFGKKDKQQASQVVVFVLGTTGIKMLGFVMRSDLSEMPEPIRADDRVAVFVPFSYGIGGFTVLVPRANIEPVDLSMEEAMRTALTAWVKSDPKLPEGVTPDDARPPIA
ncbi:MAG: DUF502 domain-containing protein [Planctomycetes bacterium]|nr:DUF502 domain-containing protein [Planctomycetota bacterium]